MRRREFITLLGSAAATAPLVARAQGPSGKIARVGIIDDALYWDAFRQQLHELHYVEGQNIAYVYLRTDGSPAQLDAAAMALAQLPVNVIVAFGTPQAQAAQRATKTIPIVAISIGDPIAAGLVTSLAHPGGNITGNTILAPEHCHQETANPEGRDSDGCAYCLSLESGQPGYCRRFRAFTSGGAAISHDCSILGSADGGGFRPGLRPDVI
jgi:hypothetical protein